MMKLKKKSIKKSTQKTTQVNRSNLWPESWDQDNLTEYKLRQIMRHNSQSTQYSTMKLKKNI